MATVDAMSGGRAELGIGAAWYEREHRFFGIPFPPLGERFDRLGEQLEVITGLWRTAPGEKFSYHGNHYQLEECASIPRPARIPPIIIGGAGPRRTPALAARSPMSSTAACRTGWPIGSPTSAGSARRPGVIRRRFGCLPRCRCAAAGPATRPPGWPSCGAAAGADTVYFHLYDVADLDHVRAARPRGPAPAGLIFGPNGPAVSPPATTRPSGGERGPRGHPASSPTARLPSGNPRGHQPVTMPRSCRLADRYQSCRLSPLLLNTVARRHRFYPEMS